MPSTEAEGTIHVAAAALRDAAGRILLARRPEHVHQGGLWEFPGGKLEPGEDVVAGLRRELDEELGIRVRAHRPLIRVRHDYPGRPVLLDVHLVTEWEHEPHGREGQPLAWVAPGQLDDYPMPAADAPIVRALRLPDRYMITRPAIHHPARFLDELDTALAGGIRMLQFRVFDRPREVLADLARECLALCRARDALMLVNGDVDLAAEIGADGVHLDSRQLADPQLVLPRDGMLLAGSTHNPGQLALAAGRGLDFCVLSPVLPTPSHPDAEPLGWERFADWVTAARLPVYALGGMTPDLLAPAWQAGAQGVAGIRGFDAQR